MRKRFEQVITAAVVGVVVAGFALTGLSYYRYLTDQYYDQILTSYASGAQRVAESLKDSGGTLDEQSVEQATRPLIGGQGRSEAVVGFIIELDDGALIEIDVQDGSPVIGHVTDTRNDPDQTRLTLEVAGRSIVLLLDDRSIHERVWRSLRVLLVIGIVVTLVVAVLSAVMTRFILKRYRDALEESNGRLEEMNARRQQMVHILLHDIVNPIGNIHSVLSLADEDPSVLEEMHDVLQFSANQALSITELVRQLERLESGKTVVENRAVDLRSAVGRSVETVRPRSEAKGVAIRTDIPETDVLAEPTSLVASVLNNLLTNAIKFSDRGGEIHITARIEGESVHLNVEDFGIGIPPRLAERLFDVTARTSRPGTEREQGTGFGMPLVARFVEAYGGRIELVSQEGDTGPLGHRGTRFEIELRRPNESR